MTHKSLLGRNPCCGLTTACLSIHQRMDPRENITRWLAVCYPNGTQAIRALAQWKRVHSQTVDLALGERYENSRQIFSLLFAQTLTTRRHSAPPPAPRDSSTKIIHSPFGSPVSPSSSLVRIEADSLIVRIEVTVLDRPTHHHLGGQWLGPAAFNCGCVLWLWL